MEELTPEEHIKIELSQKIFDLMENAIIKESTARMLADMAVDYVMNHTMSKHLDILGHPAKAQKVDVGRLVDALEKLYTSYLHDLGEDHADHEGAFLWDARQVLESAKRGGA